MFQFFDPCTFSLELSWSSHNALKTHTIKYWLANAATMHWLNMNHSCSNVCNCGYTAAEFFSNRCFYYIYMCTWKEQLWEHFTLIKIVSYSTYQRAGVWTCCNEMIISCISLHRQNKLLWTIFPWGGLLLSKRDYQSSPSCTKCTMYTVSNDYFWLWH